MVSASVAEGERSKQKAAAPPMPAVFNMFGSSAFLRGTHEPVKREAAGASVGLTNPEEVLPQPVRNGPPALGVADMFGQWGRSVHDLAHIPGRAPHTSCHVSAVRYGFNAAAITLQNV